MKPDLVRHEAEKWRRYAEEDLRSAQSLLAEEMAPRLACMLAQQAAEKALKSILVLTQTEFPKLHNLNALRNLVPPGWKFVNDFQDLTRLTEWIVEGRYPGDWPEASVEDGRTAIALAELLLAAITAEWPS